jgi:hypothetical protein
MDTTTEVELRDGQVLLHVESTNRGDESAFSVRIEAIFPDGAKSSEIFAELGVSEVAKQSFRWQTAGARYRQLVVPVITHYTDANSYGFSAVSRSVVTLAKPPPRTLDASIATVEANPSGVLEVALRSVDGNSHGVRVRLAGPVEIAFAPAVLEVEVPPSGEMLAEFEVDNVSALVSSAYAVWAITSEDTPEGIVENVFGGNVRMVEPSAFPTPRRVIWAVMGTAAILFLAFQLGAFGSLLRR